MDRLRSAAGIGTDKVGVYAQAMADEVGRILAVAAASKKPLPNKNLTMSPQAKVKEEKEWEEEEKEREKEGVFGVELFCALIFVTGNPKLM